MSRRVDFYLFFRYHSTMFMVNLLNSKWAVFCLLVLVVLAVFGRTIWFDYIQLDEGILLVNNNFFISKISNFFEVFKHDINYPSAVAPYYRPVFILSFMLNSQFDKLMASQISSSPLAYHVGNILLHIVAAFLVFGLLRELGVKKIVSVLFSFLFAIHPAVTPVVAWVPGRIEAILAIFTVFSFIMFMRFLRTSDWRYLIGFFLSFAAALFTKEVALSLLPVLLFYYLTYRKEKGSEMIVTLSSGLAAIILAWFFVRKNIIADAQISDLSLFEMLAVLWSNSSAFFLYLGKAVLPFNLTVFPVLESSTLVYGFVALAILAVSWFLQARPVKPIALPVLGLVWFVVFLIPSLVSYNFPENMVFFEHRLYLPLVGIIIFFASLKLKKRGQVPFLLQKRDLTPFFVVVLFSVLTYNYSSAYKDKIVFWQKAVTDSPLSFQAHNSLATAYLTDGKIEEAMIEFNKTLKINPKAKRVHLLLGLYYLDQNQYDEAKAEFEKEIEIDPKQFVAYHNLGRIDAQRKNLKKAEKNFLKALDINSDYVLVQQDLTVLYFSQNKHSQAIVHLKKLLKLQTVESLHPQIRKILEIYVKEAALQMGL